MSLRIVPDDQCLTTLDVFLVVSHRQSVSDLLILGFFGIWRDVDVHGNVLGGIVQQSSLFHSGVQVAACTFLFHQKHARPEQIYSRCVSFEVDGLSFVHGHVLACLPEHLEEEVPKRLRLTVFAAGKLHRISEFTREITQIQNGHT